jgi:hypothetical protein
VSGKERDVFAFAFLHRALAFPIYAIALIMDFISAALGSLAAWIAGDAWPV